MKKYIILMFGIFLMTPSIYSQTVQTWTETFDGSTSFSATPSLGAWVPNPVYYVPGSSGTNPQSYHGFVPSISGDSTILLSPIYDCNAYSFIMMQFSHICKVSPQDVARIDYRRDGGGGMGAWETLPGGEDYLGDATNYNTTGFNAASYSDWKANDSTAFPAQSWWKEESFDLSFWANTSYVQFRFVIKRGQVAGTQLSYGWLIDNFQLSASPYKLAPPVVQFLPPVVQDTVYGTGPYEINARVKTATSASIETPWLKYTATNGAIIVNDSVAMTKVQGDSIWKGVIPQFVAGTTVSYSITGKDTTGNQATIMSSYIIKAENLSFAKIGDENSTNLNCYTPIGLCEEYAWNRMLYLASELGTTTKGQTIIALEWQSDNFSGTINNQKCYVWEVTNTTLATGYIDPTTVAGAVEVFSGTITFVPGWNKVYFSQPFILSAGKNLQVYWENKHGINFSAVGHDFVRTNATNMAVDAHASTNTVHTLPGTLTQDRPNVRFTFYKPTYNHSAELYSIDIKDTIPVALGLQVPIVATVKNKGSVNLTAATVYYAVNGDTSQAISWTGNLPWDMNKQDTLGYYIPKVNGHDTIKVWITLPNGQTDSATIDDAQSKIIYGSSDIIMSFVSPEDTVYNTGPFEISAHIRTLSGAPVGAVSLNVIITYEGTPTTSLIPMVFDSIAGLWKATIPKTQFGSDIYHSITITDGLGNVVVIENSFYLKRGGLPTNEQIIIGTGSNLANQDTPIHMYHYNSWSKQLYLESEIPSIARGGTINKIAWSYAATSAQTRNNQRCYMRLIDDVNLNDAKWDPQDDPTNPANDMTFVWGTKTLNISNGWVEITLDQPFVWTKGKNLLIYWYNEQGSTSHTYNYNWNHTNYPNTMVVFTNNDNVLTHPNQANATQWSGDRPNVRLEMFYIKDAGAGVDTSVALVGIENPSYSGIVGVSEPVRVKLTNKGAKYLHQCTFEWTINGDPQPSATYNNVAGVPEDFSDTVTIGYYTPQLGQYDTIVIWASMPNGKLDSILNDDTLSIVVLGCSGDLHGEMIVGAGGDFTSIDHALASIRECGLTGDLTLKLKGIYAENVDLTDFNPYLKGHHLTITSSDNDADSVTIQPASGVGITLGDVRNITIEKITVNTASITTNAIQFVSACTNVVIRDCKLLTHPTTSNQIAPIYKADKTGVGNSISIIGNTLDGGYAGFYFYGGIDTGASKYATYIVFDSNTVTNNHAYGMCAYYTDFSRISYNTITTRATGSQTWNAMMLRYANGDIMDNRIIQQNPNIPMDGIYLKEYNYYLTNKKALIANNELIYQATNSKGTGMYSDFVKADFLHNSFYLSSGGEVNGFYMQTVENNTLTIKNNNIVTIGNSGHVLAYSTSTGVTSQYDIDYNNFYSNRNALVYYNSATISSLAALRQSYPTALHMVSVSPAYVDINDNTDLLPSNTGLYAPSLPSITQDIEGKPRTGQATMGAYQIIPNALDLSLNQFVLFNTEVLNNQVISVDVEVQSFSTNTVQNAVFGWSLNGQPMVSVPWTPTAAMSFFDKENVNIGSFTVDNLNDTYEVVVWIESVNSVTDMYPRNDTIQITAARMLLVDFVAPFVEDSTNALSFDVYAHIRTTSGAPDVSPPKLYITSVINEGRNVLHDSITMTLEHGDWKATVPEQYHNSKVIYSMTVSDTLGNTTTIVDSTYITTLGIFPTPDLTIGTGTGTVAYNIYYSYYSYSHTRNYYMDYEINPKRLGGTIYSIAFYCSGGNGINTNVSFYLKAVPDSTISQGSYVEPGGEQATLVWGPATHNRQTGWNVFVLDAPFVLPPEQNLLIYCNNQDGSWSDNGSTTSWQYTSTAPRNGSYRTWNDNTWPPTGNSHTSGDRPNLQLNIDLIGETIYTGYDLAITNMLTPVNDPNELCTPDYSPVEIIINNKGENDYDFTTNPVSLSVEVINPLGTVDTAFVIVNTGTLESGESDSVELMSNLLIKYAGVYNIKVWLDSPIDTKRYDDTLVYEFISGRVSLPIDEDFSGATMPIQFVTIPLVGSEVWEPYTDTNDTILPPEGNGILRYVGSRGTMTQLSTRQLDLFGAVDPKMEFWYYHDTATSELDNSYTEVRVVADGVTHVERTLYRKGTTHGWEFYTVDLRPYTSAQCVLIQFESMNRYGAEAAQYIGHVFITSTPDLAVSEIIVSPETTVCDLTNKEVRVVLSATLSQAIDFNRTPSNLAVRIGSQQLTPYTLQNTISGNTSDTILIASDVDLTGVTNITAYLTSPVDGNPLNDSTNISFDFRPSLSVTLNPVTNMNSRITVGAPVWQEVIIENTGNVELSGIELVLRITGTNQYIVRETLPIALAPNEIDTHQFVNSYIVPEDERYQVSLIAYLRCDSAHVNDGDAIDEYVDLHNLSVISIDNPPIGQLDTIGTAINITVSVRNTDDLNSFEEVAIYAVIENEEGQSQINRLGSIAEIPPSETKQYTFGEPYTVPEDSVYRIRVYIAKVDNYQGNDTTGTIRRTVKRPEVSVKEIDKANVFTLGQNIPNPADNRTRIDYSIPEAGEVIFHVHSVSGQLLYSKTIEAMHGKQSIELNTSAFAAGIYFYSIEYKGQRLVKRMMIND